MKVTPTASRQVVCSPAGATIAGEEALGRRGCQKNHTKTREGTHAQSQQMPYEHTMAEEVARCEVSCQALLRHTGGGRQKKVVRR